MTLIREPGRLQLIGIEASNHTSSVPGVVVDLGTTTVAVQLVDLGTGRILATRTDYNAQIPCGLDVIGPSKFNFGGIGRWMFKKMMKNKKVTMLPELRETMIDLGVQLHGGAGYMQEYPICGMYTDARINRILAGSSEIMKYISGRDMGTDNYSSILD